MTSWGIVTYSLVVFWLMPGAYWRPSAMSLLVTWAIGEANFSLTNTHVPELLYYFCDITVLVTVLLFRTHWTDFIIILPFPCMWYLYGADKTYSNWLILVLLTLGQFIAAGPWKRARDSKPAPLMIGEFLTDFAGFIRWRFFGRRVHA